MATLTQHHIGKLTQRPWGWEVRVDYIDDVKRIHNEVLHFSRQPGEKAIAVSAESRRAELEKRINDAILAEQRASRQLLSETEKASLQAVEATVIDYVKKRLESSTLATSSRTTASEWIALVDTAMKEVQVAEKPTATLSTETVTRS
jgi:cell division protein FtsL